MPIAVRELGGLAVYGWAFSAFMLASVVGITVSGRLTDRRGPGDAFAVGLTLFGLGLLGGGAAPSMGVLIAARAVQGFGGGGLSAVIYASVARCYPPERQPRMLALLSTAWVVPGLVGPGLGGFVADHASWRLVFVGLTPVALLVRRRSRCPRSAGSPGRAGRRRTRRTPRRSGSPSSSRPAAPSCSWRCRRARCRRPRRCWRSAPRPCSRACDD